MTRPDELRELTEQQHINRFIDTYFGDVPFDDASRERVVKKFAKEIAARSTAAHRKTLEEAGNVKYDSDRLGYWVFIGASDRIKALDDLYWSYVMEQVVEPLRPFTKEHTYESELAFIKTRMKRANFSEVGLELQLARADQYAKERIAHLEPKSAEEKHGYR